MNYHVCRVAWPWKLSTTNRTPTLYSRCRLASCTQNAKSRRYRSICGTPGSRKSSKRWTTCKSVQLRHQLGLNLSWSASRAPFLSQPRRERLTDEGIGVVKEFRNCRCERSSTTLQQTFNMIIRQKIITQTDRLTNNIYLSTFDISSRFIWWGV